MENTFTLATLPALQGFLAGGQSVRGLLEDGAFDSIDVIRNPDMPFCPEFHGEAAAARAAAQAIVNNTYHQVLVSEQVRKNQLVQKATAGPLGDIIAQFPLLATGFV
jgi:hypothetical protein